MIFSNQDIKSELQQFPSFPDSQNNHEKNNIIENSNPNHRMLESGNKENNYYNQNTTLRHLDIEIKKSIQSNNNIE